MDLIGKKYRVLKTLGQGAMGEVFLVLPTRGDPVALKLLKTSEVADQKPAIEQFENEFKVLKKLSHPNIGRIHDYGYDEDLKKVYFTSPWLKGTDIFVATKDLLFEKCEEYFVQMLRALNYLHQKGIIHCDLKPGNIFIENDHVELIDFGLAGYWGESIVGTPTYLAPEIYRGEHHTVASDLYAVGVILYNCLTRTQPFSGKSLQEVYDRHRTHTPSPMSQFNASIPSYFSDIASTLLAKKPQERYPSAAAVIDEIAAYSKTKYSVETPETLMSYLPTNSELIGRKEAQWHIENQVGQFLSDKNKVPYVGLFLHGEHGVGKTKFIAQIKTKLQLEKISVEEALLPLSESDLKVLKDSKTIILQNAEDYLGVSKDLNPFLSFLEQKILSPETSRFLFIVSSSDKEAWKPFEKLFPREEFAFESVWLPPFDLEETRYFLETIIGQKEIPDRFVSDIYHNTRGNPGICQNIVEKLIEQGFLFDASGRWSSDLLHHLEGTLKKMDTPKSLEERLQVEYDSLIPQEKEVVHWLAMGPHGLSQRMLERLMEDEESSEELDLSPIVASMTDKKFIRLEENKRFVLYRSAFVPFIQKIIPGSDQKDRHTRIAEEEIDLNQLEIWYHLSHGRDRLLVQTSLENMGESLSRDGKREQALECYERLNRIFVDVPLPQRLDWVIKNCEILIWLDRFKEASELLDKIENEINQGKEMIPLKTKLLLWEKKGLSLLHQQKIDQAKFYFSEGLKLATTAPETQVEEIRFVNDLAQIDLINGQTDEAIRKFSTSREMAQKLMTRDLQKITNNDLGHVYFRIKNYEKAIELLQEDARLFSVLSYREPVARALYTLAESLRAQKKFKKAKSEYERCIQICQKENLLPILLRAYNGLGNIHIMHEDTKHALDDYQRAIEISVWLKDPTTKAALLANQGLIYRKENNWPQASRRFLLSKQILEEKQKRLAYDNELLSKCYTELTSIAREEKDTMKALSFQLERMRMVENSPTLKPEEFTVKLELVRLYLDNRLSDPFQSEIIKLEQLAKTDQEREAVLSIKTRWNQIQNFDQENTMRVPDEDIA